MISYGDMLDTIERNELQNPPSAAEKKGGNEPENKDEPQNPPSAAEKKGGNEPENKDESEDVI